MREILLQTSDNKFILFYYDEKSNSFHCTRLWDNKREILIVMATTDLLNLIHGLVTLLTQRINEIDPSVAPVYIPAEKLNKNNC